MAEPTAPRKTSPLQGMTSPAAGITLTERPFLGKVIVRGGQDDDAFVKTTADVLGAALPAEPNTVVRSGDLTLFWLGPNEWLVHTPEDGQGALVERLRAALAGVHSAVVDVSDYYVVIELKGERARDVLARGCTIDTHPRNFGPGQCAQSVYAHASILLYQEDEAPTYLLQVRWSFAEYLWSYLADAARQFEAA